MVTAARGAWRSVRVNLVAAITAVAVGLALAISWHSPAIAGFSCVLGCAASAVATFNGPYPTLERMRLRWKRSRDRLLRMVGLKRTATH